MTEFASKVVIITGAAGGIGKETVRKFAKEGAKIALVDLNYEALQATAKELALEEDQYILIAADVSKEEEVANYVQRTKERFGQIDVFFNNAGIEGAFALLTDYPSDALDKVVNINIKGVFYGLKHVLQVMQQQKSGSIINTASAGAKAALPFTSAYIASKAAVLGLTKAAAMEYAEHGIRVNAICPGPTNTRFMRSVEASLSPGKTEEYQAMVRQSVPLGRYAEPADIANTVLYLASENSSYVTGTDIDVDGGYLAR
ncbi:SDR family NAD(P)-dependent oxidoreductase [Bacillus sp. X1(2014)]|uniref:SDR family NAD(P)-dependent oxidoreductase n=1 Tax=Bacillus sp. X1(2014) TaxID=1565991 RepID=UPI0011A85E7D|nr:SDR family oxidoreductase [Bacillus sp. X1(2014)]